jgi:hypothetical protein
MTAGFFGKYATTGIPGLVLPSVQSADNGEAFQAYFQSQFGTKEEKPESGYQPLLNYLKDKDKRDEGVLLRMLSPEFQRQQLENKLRFDREQMAQAAPYKLAFALPGQIMTAFTKPAEIALAGQLASSQALASGASGAANIIANAAGNIPNLTNYQRTTQGYSPKSYF